MEAQPAHRTTGTPYARPQQPTDSSVAALPTETLQQIFELALEDEEDPFERQSTRRALGAVCYHWCSVMPPATEYAVKSATEARKLALKLKQSGRGGKVQLVAIRLNAVSSVDRSGRTAMLLDACRNVEHSSVDLGSALSGYSDQSGGFGGGLYKAMKKLVQLRRLDLHGEAFLTPHVLAELLENLNLLQHLSILVKLQQTPRNSVPTISPASALRHLNISGDLALVQALVPHLAPIERPLSLVLQEMIDKYPLIRPSPTHVAQILLPLAKRLESFTAPDKWAPDAAFTAFSAGMINVRVLEIHGSIVESLPHLDSLAELREITISSPPGSYYITSVKSLLEHLPPRFQRLRLPPTTSGHWKRVGMVDVEELADRQQIELVWTRGR